MAMAASALEMGDSADSRTTAAPDHIPEPLIEQLKVGGRLVLPVGDAYQELLRLTKTESGVRVDTLLPVRFVPMTGEALEEN